MPYLSTAHRIISHALLTTLTAAALVVDIPDHVARGFDADARMHILIKKQLTLGILPYLRLKTSIEADIVGAQVINLGFVHKSTVE